MPSGYTFDSSHGPGVGMSSSGSSGSGSSYTSSSSGSGSSLSNKIIGAAQNIANTVKSNTSVIGDRMREYLSNPSSSAKMANLYDGYISNYGNAFDMDEYFDKLMDMADYNNQWSANQAQKAMEFEDAQALRQMQYQTRSDQAAMAWSAKEAQKSRDWTENLSNTAHQREIKDLLAAGLNPILSANGGAWSGSGTTGQGFSSSGAMASGLMGQTDMGVTATVGSMMANQMTAARDIAITKMQLDQQRYNTDQQYAMAKMAAETSIYNNNNNIDANKAIRALDRDADIRKAGIQASATRDAAAASAGAILGAANTQAAAARYGYDTNLTSQREQRELEKYKYDNVSGDTKYEGEHNLMKDPIQYGLEGGKTLVNSVVDIMDMLGQIENRNSPHVYNENGSGKGF